jgi:hypothetical protein
MHWTQRLTLKLRLNLESEKNNYDLSMRFISQNPLPAEIKVFSETSTRLNLEKKQIIKDYYDEKITEYTKVLSVSKNFTSVVQSHLLKK